MTTMTDSISSAPDRTASRLTLGLIMGIPIAIVLLSSLMFYTGIGTPTSTANQGDLINPPRQLADYGIVFEPQSYDGKPLWSLLQIANVCDQACADNLYYSRQFKTALGRRSVGLQRILWLPEGQSLAPELVQQHPNLIQQAAPSASAQTALLQGLAPFRYLLVDARGFVMMSYSDQHDYKQISKDLKFLLTRSGY